MEQSTGGETNNVELILPDYDTLEAELLNVTEARLDHGNLAGAAEALSWSNHLGSNGSFKNSFQEFLEGEQNQILSGEWCVQIKLSCNA